MRNFLGQLDTLAEAVATLLRFTEADAGGARDLKLWHEDRERVPVDLEQLRRAADG